MFPRQKLPPSMQKSTYKDILKFLQKVNPKGLTGQIGRRTCTMVSLIQSCIRNGHCRLESLSEASGAYKTKKISSLLQQSKRWLSNKWTDWESFYMPFASHFLAGIATKGELILIIDGSQTGTANTTLMVSALCRGFAIPVAWVVKNGEKGNFPKEMHIDVLQMIAPICPPDCRVVLLGDGEFDGEDLIQWCVDQGWEFVVRTSCNRLIDFSGEIARFDSIQTTRSMCFIRDAIRLANAVYWYKKKYKAPIYLLTNMDLGYQACHYYKLRFEIETLFKQLKSGGFQLHKTRLKCPLKVSNLIIVVAFAFVFSFCMGAFIKEHQPLHVLETIVKKGRLKNIRPIALAQIAIRKGHRCVLHFFSDFTNMMLWFLT